MSKIGVMSSKRYPDVLYKSHLTPPWCPVQESSYTPLVSCTRVIIHPPGVLYKSHLTPPWCPVQESSYTPLVSCTRVILHPPGVLYKSHLTPPLVSCTRVILHPPGVLYKSHLTPPWCPVQESSYTPLVSCTRVIIHPPGVLYKSHLTHPWCPVQESSYTPLVSCTRVILHPPGVLYKSHLTPPRCPVQESSYTPLVSCRNSCWVCKNMWAPPSEYVSSSIPSWQTLTAHAQPFRGARDLAFFLKVPLDSLLVWASSEGSGETARIRRLAWTFAVRTDYKYQIRLTRSM